MKGKSKEVSRKTIVKFRLETIPGADILLGRAIRLGKDGKHEEALAEFENAMEREMKNPNLWIGKGSALWYLGKKDPAMDCYEKALEIDPKAHLAWYNKSTIFALRNDEKSLKESVTKAIALNPYYKEKIQWDDDFKTFQKKAWFKELIND